MPPTSEYELLAGAPMFKNDLHLRRASGPPRDPRSSPRKRSQARQVARHAARADGMNVAAWRVIGDGGW